ncbi:MAG TPA: hypothetical protein VK936_11570, partial [Longimicrobiales bacterium]|nr:hypothetical protein [Longimicrobiales bacterium]
TGAGVEVERSLYDGGARWVARELGYEITQSKWGEQSARQRTNSDDPQVQLAADLLSRATTPESLFTLAGSQEAQEDAVDVGRSAGVQPTPAPR